MTSHDPILKSTQESKKTWSASWMSRKQQSPKFLTQSIALEESGVPGVLRTGTILISFLVAVFLVWATFAEVDEVATASGQIVPSGYIQEIQHLEGGIIRDILVEEGDLVQSEQVLLKLDDTNANADLGQIRARQKALELQASRLRRYTQTSSNQSNHSLTSEEQEILSSMEDARTSQENVLKNQIVQKEKELQGIRASAATLEKNLVLMREEHSINKKMAKRGSVSKVMVMTSERELNALAGQLEENKSLENQSLEAITEAQNRLQSLNADLRQEAMKNLGQVEAELSEINKSIAKQEGASSRTVVKAPVRGLVKGLTVHTLGAVIDPGRTLMEIVPVEEELIVEALVSPNDIGNLEPGSDVNVKVSAYNFSRYGSVKGKLKSVSASTFQTEKGETFYRAKIRLDKNYVGKDATRNLILPGMVVQADIVTGQKTVLQYLLKPMHMITQTAFHER